MKTALIGHSGFVGKNLAKQFAFDDKYNSKNIDDIRSKQYELVVCSGISASMWAANNFPEQDLENINSLLQAIKTIKADKFILISSTAVFAQPVKDVDEDSQDFESISAYGKNRRYAEEFVADNFNNNLIVRLPALFGDGLEKNFIYDLLNQEPAFMPTEKFGEVIAAVGNEGAALLNKYYALDKGRAVFCFDKAAAIANNERGLVLDALQEADFTALKFTNSESMFQFYNLDNLWTDINIALKNSIDCLHISSQPVKAKEIAKHFFDIEFNNDNEKPAFDYNMKTKYAKFWGKENGYQYSKEDIFKSLGEFLK